MVFGLLWIMSVDMSLNSVQLDTSVELVLCLPEKIL